MEQILKAADAAVKQAYSMVEYVEKEIATKQKSLETYKTQADILKSEYNELLEKLKIQP